MWKIFGVGWGSFKGSMKAAKQLHCKLQSVCGTIDEKSPWTQPHQMVLCIRFSLISNCQFFSRWVPQMTKPSHNYPCLRASWPGLQRARDSLWIQLRYWMKHGSPLSVQKAKCSLHSGIIHTHLPQREFVCRQKIMVFIFWDARGIILSHCVLKGITVIDNSYCGVLEKQWFVIAASPPDQAWHQLFICD